MPCVGTDFVSAYQFAATGASAKRTLPDRLSDVINVKDWGAKGDNSTNDTTSIQAAITYAMTNGGVVFFPPGVYKTHNLTVGSSSANVGVIITGSGRGVTTISALDSSGPVFSAGGQTFDCLQEVSNMNFVGSFQTMATFTRSNVVASGIDGGGSPGFDTSAATGARINDCSLTGGTRPGATASPHLVDPTTSVGIATGTLTTVRNVRIQGGYGAGFAVSGNCASILGCACEDCAVGVRIGWGPVGGGTFGEVAAVGCTIINVQTERTNSQYELYNATGCFVGAHVSTGFEGTPQTEGSITNMSWSAGSPPTVTVTAPSHGMSNGTYRLQVLSPSPSGFAVTGTPAGWVLATVSAGGSFTYTSPGSSNPGAFVSSGGWNWPLQYGIRVRIANQCTIVASNFTANNSVAAVDLDYGGDSSANQQNNVIFGLNGNQGWIAPRAKNRAGWKFVECTGAVNPFDTVYGSGSAGFPATIAIPTSSMNYADLPGGASSSVQPGPFEGQEYDIVDSTVAASGNFAATTSGGGSNHVKVRYDGSNWRISG